MNKQIAIDKDLKSLRGLMASQETTRLLDELRSAWGIAASAPIVVIGQLNTLSLSEGKTLHFLERLEHPETGVGLIYPGGSGPAKAFVFAADIARLVASKRSWAIAELQLSPVEARERRANIYECTVRAGSLRSLRDLPKQWNVKVHGKETVHRIADAAFAAIQAQQQEAEVRLKAEQQEREAYRETEQRERTARLEADFVEAGNRQSTALKQIAKEVAQLEINRNTQERAVKIAQIQAQDEALEAAKRLQRFTQETQDMKERLHRLTDLLADKSRRLVALGLMDESDLQRLLPQAQVPDTQPSHDFRGLFNADFSRLAPFVQARLWKTGMLFTQAQLRDFLALLRTHDVIVLAGDSGSGKTSLVRTVAESIGGRCAVIPVKPNWTGPEDLLGYYNPIERSYQPTPFLLALQAAQAEPNVPHFICLDEMNLARVEYYFADFLSLLETRKESPKIPLYASDEERHAVMENSLFLSIEAEVRSRLGLSEATTLEDILKNEEANGLLHRLGGFKDAESVLLHHARLRRSLAGAARTPTALQFPPNVRIIGAVNVDETTHYLSTKVLDRVHILRFRNPVLIDWDAVEQEVEKFDIDLSLPLNVGANAFGAREDYPPFDRHDPDAAFLAGLARRQLDPLGVEFGLRAIRQSLNYLHQAQITGINRNAALNNVMLHKILPKLMLDLSRSGGDGRPRRDILVALRKEVADRLQVLDPKSITESCVDALDKLIAAADANNGIANYWLR